MRKILGYVVSWENWLMQEGKGSYYRKDELGLLWAGTRIATVFPTYEAARNAVRRSVRHRQAIGASDEMRDYTITRVAR